MGVSSSPDPHGDTCWDADEWLKVYLPDDDGAQGGGAGDMVAANRLGKWDIDTAGMNTEVRPGVSDEE